MPKSDNDVEKILASVILEKFGFRNEADRKPLLVSRDLSDIAKGAGCGHLSAPSARDNDLVQSLKHLMHGAGLFSTMYKAGVLWPKETLINRSMLSPN